ncbi:MAG: hypothetical protein WC269_05710 [Candidatus Gracilibacteria bacterium]|jgi:hypothetical protein
MKPIYKFIVVFLILGIIAWIIYFVVSKTNTGTGVTLETATTTTEGVAGETKGVLDEPITGGTTGQNDTNTETFNEENPSGAIKTSFKELRKISDVPAQFYWYYAENNRIFYITKTGEIKKVIDGKSEAIALNPLSNVSIVRPNRGGSFVLLKFTTDTGTIWGVFSSMDEKITPLNSSIVDAVWDFYNENITASLSNGGGISIVSLLREKNYSENTVLIPEIKLFDVDMVNKSPNELLFVEKFGNEYATSIWQYSKKTNLVSIVRSGLLDFSLNPTLSAYFFSSKNDGFVIGNSSFERDFPTTQKTLPEKCSSAVVTAFCFVPQVQVSFFDWVTNSVFSNDSLYVYDLDQQTENRIPISDITKTPIDAKNIIPTASSLYFINKYDNFIYAFI